MVIISLAEASAILLLIVLVEALLTPVLGIVALLLLVVLLLLLSLLVLGHEVASVGLAGLEGLGAGLEGRDTRAESTLRLGGVHVELLLRLARQILVLGSRVVLPGVEVRHIDFFSSPES